MMPWLYWFGHRHDAKKMASFAIGLSESSGLGADRTEIGNSSDVPTINNRPQIFVPSTNASFPGRWRRVIGVKFRRRREHGHAATATGKATLVG